MLVGVVAFNVLKVMDVSDPRAIGVLLVGYFFQGACAASVRSISLILFQVSVSS